MKNENCIQTKINCIQKKKDDKESVKSGCDFVTKNYSLSDF